jgi:glycosyltransferase involved in cell wall biosynthesis
LLECHADALPKDAQFVLSGQLEPELEKERAFIRAQSERITHIDRYLNECEIRALYEASDYVLLPYTTDFSGSSGVLATAAATGKPVITTNHGVVGMRTTTYGLGYTYPSGNAAALAAILATLPDTKSFEYAALRDRGLQFAELNSVNAFCARLVNQD